MVAGLDPDVALGPTRSSCTAFIGAAERGRLAVVQALLHRGAAPTAAKSGTGDTALHRAAAKAPTEIARLLLGAGAEVDAPNVHGGTALMASPSTAVSALLLGAGADPNAVRRDTGWTALCFAARSGDLSMVRLLMEHGAHPPGAAPVLGTAVPGNHIGIGTSSSTPTPTSTGHGGTTGGPRCSPLRSTGTLSWPSWTADGRTALEHAQANGHGRLATVLTQATQVLAQAGNAAAAAGSVTAARKAAAGAHHDAS